MQTVGTAVIPAASDSAMASDEAFPALTVPKLTYLRGKVTKILQETQLPDQELALYFQTVQVKLANSDELVSIQIGNEFQPLNAQQRLRVNEELVIGKQELSNGQIEYVVADVYRLPILLWLFVGFLALVVLIAKKQGASAIVGMCLSFAVLMLFIVPHILLGENPVVNSLIGCGAVALISVYLSHGWSWESHLALLSMLLSLAAVALLASIAVNLAKLVGLGSEEAYYLQFGPSAKLNLQGLLLGGIMLGTLGVLDDITIAQVSVVTQIRSAKPHIEFPELYSRALTVGKDHVASLVNTLVLAYAGSSLPLFLLFTLNTAQPAWTVLNSEMVAEEIVRTLAGSIGLVLAVPLTTIAASFFALRYHHLTKENTGETGHLHQH